MRWRRNLTLRSQRQNDIFPSFRGFCSPLFVSIAYFKLLHILNYYGYRPELSGCCRFESWTRNFGLFGVIVSKCLWKLNTTCERRRKISRRKPACLKLHHCLRYVNPANPHLTSVVGYDRTPLWKEPSVKQREL